MVAENSPALCRSTKDFGETLWNDPSSEALLKKSNPDTKAKVPDALQGQVVAESVWQHNQWVKEFGRPWRCRDLRYSKPKTLMSGDRVPSSHSGLYSACDYSLRGAPIFDAFCPCCVCQKRRKDRGMILRPEDPCFINPWLSISQSGIFLLDPLPEESNQEPKVKTRLAKRRIRRSVLERSKLVR